MPPPPHCPSPQIDTLSDVAQLLQNHTEGYWDMVNGYCLPKDPKCMSRLGARLQADPALQEAVRNAIQVAPLADLETLHPAHMACLVLSMHAGLGEVAGRGRAGAHQCR